MDEQLAAARRVLVIRLDNIGDIVNLTPALRALRLALPDARITLMASEAGAAVRPMLPWVDDLIVHRALWQELPGPRRFTADSELRLAGTLRACAFDAAFIFTSFTQSPFPPAYLCFLAEIPRRIAQARDFGGMTLTDCVLPLADDAHQVDRNLHLLQGVAIQNAGSKMELRIPASAAQSARRMLRDAGVNPRRYIAAVPGASCPARAYPLAHFKSAVEMAADSLEIPLVVLGGPAEHAIASAFSGAGSNPRVTSLVGRTSVPQFAALISSATAVIANNSAAMHLADALSVPVVAIFSGTDRLSQWRPRNVRHRLLKREVACAPCYRMECPIQLQCLAFAPAEVVGALADLLGERRTETERCVETVENTNLAHSRQLSLLSVKDSAHHYTPGR